VKGGQAEADGGEGARVKKKSSFPDPAAPAKSKVKEAADNGRVDTREPTTKGAEKLPRDGTVRVHWQPST